MNSFKEMGLNPLVQTSLDTLKFTVPTPIQAQTIPFGLAGKDVLGSAQTGTGKTLAFVVPMINRLLENPTESALVLVPTRELAQQVAQTVRQLLGPKPVIKTALLIGGESPFKQLHQLRANARILVGTPGRIIDHLKREAIKPEGIHFLVLDETDRMFDMGFESQIEQIIKQLPTDRQTVMFSATLPASIVKTASRYLNSPERVTIGTDSTPISKIKQEVIFVAEADKEAKLIEQLAHRQESIVIFVKTKWGAERLAEKLAGDFEYKAIALHGDLRQNKRERVINSFRKGTHNILVATDIAARGLDIPQIRHIINYDLPQCPEDYIHRIGRTARAGAEGFSLCLVTPKESRNWKIIDRFANSTDGITDSDRASLSHRGGSRGGNRSFGGGDRRGGGRSFDRERRGGFGGGDRSRSQRRSFGDDRPKRFDRSSSDRFSQSTEKSDSSFFQDREKKFENRAPRGERTFSDRPFSNRRRSDDGFRKEGNGERRSFGRSFENNNGFEKRGPRKPFDGGERSQNSSFERSPFKRSSDRPARDGFRPSRPPFDRFSKNDFADKNSESGDRSTSFKRKFRD